MKQDKEFLQYLSDYSSSRTTFPHAVDYFMSAVGKPEGKE
jgi:hypothetical protein